MLAILLLYMAVAMLLVAVAVLLISVAMLIVVVAVLLISVAMLLVASALLLLIARTLLLRTVFSMMTAAHTVLRTHLLVSLILVFRKDAFQFLFIRCALFKALLHLSFLLISEFRTLSCTLALD